MTSADTAERFRTAVEKRDLAALEPLFTEDIRLYSPVKFTPFEGRPMVLGLFGVLLRTFEDFRYVGQLDGTAETAVDGA
ncbi:nuclear transport factor 2 family protein, partial [Streptomyces sp. 24-1644]